MNQMMREYLSMSGYASFIWPAYGIAALVLVSFAVDSWRRLRKATEELRRLEAKTNKPMTLVGGNHKPDQRARS